MPKAKTNVVKFPTSRIVERHGFLDHRPEVAELEAAWKSARQAIVALQNQERSLLRRIHLACGITAPASFYADDARRAANEVRKERRRELNERAGIRSKVPPMSPETKAVLRRLIDEAEDVGGDAA